MSVEVLNSDRPDETAADRLIAAALDAFAAGGFHGATTREIAARAGVNLAAIPYYFGSKERLYCAVAERIAARMAGHMKPALDSARWAAGEPEVSAKVRRATLLMLLDQFALFLLSEETSDNVGRFVLHEQMAPTGAFDILFDRAIGPLVDAIAGLLGRLLDRSATDPEMRVRAGMLLGQVIVFRATRAMMLRALGRDRYGEAEHDTIRALISEHTRSLVDALMGETG